MLAHIHGPTTIKLTYVTENLALVRQQTCLKVRATRVSITGPRSSCSRWTSSMIRSLTILASAISPVLFRVTTSHFSGVVTSIYTSSPSPLNHYRKQTILPCQGRMVYVQHHKNKKIAKSKHALQQQFLS